MPYSNHQSVSAPEGLTVPLTVADEPPIALTAPVNADGGAAAAPCARPRQTSAAINNGIDRETTHPLSLGVGRKRAVGRM